MDFYFVDVIVKFNKVNLLQTNTITPQIDISIFILTHATPVTRRHQLFTAEPSE